MTILQGFMQEREEQDVKQPATRVHHFSYIGSMTITSIIIFFLVLRTQQWSSKYHLLILLIPVGQGIDDDVS